MPVLLYAWSGSLAESEKGGGISIDRMSLVEIVPVAPSVVIVPVTSYPF